MDAPDLRPEDNPPLPIELAADGADHSGVVFVDEETIVSRDIGGLVKAILVL